MEQELFQTGDDDVVGDFQVLYHIGTTVRQFHRILGIDYLHGVTVAVGVFPLLVVSRVEVIGRSIGCREGPVEDRSSLYPLVGQRDFFGTEVGILGIDSRIGKSTTYRLAGLVHLAIAIFDDCIAGNEAGVLLEFRVDLYRIEQGIVDNKHRVVEGVTRSYRHR